jgi:flagellar biosynthesis protein
MAGSDDGSLVTQKSAPDRSSLAIALANMTAEAVAAASDRTRDPTLEAGPGAPRVVASGRGAVAEQILQIAFERGVKVRTDSDLAEILAAVEVDSEIPLAALAGVAEILRYLYRTDGASAARTEAPRGGRESDEETRP